MSILALALWGVILMGPPGGGLEQQGSPAQSVPRAQTELVPLVNTYWKLVGLADVKTVEQPGAREPHVVFNASGAVTGSDGCNSIRASYASSRDSLKIGVLMGTLAACSLPDRLDRRFREALVITRSWKIADGELTLLDENGTILARLEARQDR
jgi:heat shock protein HslJ